MASVLDNFQLLFFEVRFLNNSNHLRVMEQPSAIIWFILEE